MPANASTYAATHVFVSKILLARGAADDLATREIRSDVLAFRNKRSRRRNDGSRRRRRAAAELSKEFPGARGAARDVSRDSKRRFRDAVKDRQLHLVDDEVHGDDDDEEDDEEPELAAGGRLERVARRVLAELVVRLVREDVRRDDDPDPGDGQAEDAQPVGAHVQPAALRRVAPVVRAVARAAVVRDVERQADDDELRDEHAEHDGRLGRDPLVLVLGVLPLDEHVDVDDGEHDDADEQEEEVEDAERVRRRGGHRSFRRFSRCVCLSGASCRGNEAPAAQLWPLEAGSRLFYALLVAWRGLCSG